jgi:sec-independent protein translocase protein TatC
MGAEHDVRMPLTAHLDELRTRLIRAIAIVGVGFAAAYWFAEPLVTWLLVPLTALCPEEALVIGTGVTDAFFTKLKVAFIAGVFLASPAVFYQAWHFVAPGLYEKERRIALPFSFAASFFFVGGAAFCYYLVFPVAFRFFLEEFRSVGISPQIRVTEYLTFASRMLLAFGVTFELPVVTFFLARVGLVTHHTLIGWTRYAIVTIFVVAAVLTPGPDIASQLLMATPLLVLYGLSIGIAWLVGRPAAATRADDATERGAD